MRISPLRFGTTVMAVKPHMTLSLNPLNLASWSVVRRPGAGDELLRLSLDC